MTGTNKQLSQLQLLSNAISRSQFELIGNIGQVNSYYREKNLSQNNYLVRSYDKRYGNIVGYLGVGINSNSSNKILYPYNHELVYNIYYADRENYINALSQLFTYLDNNPLTYFQRLKGEYIENFNLDNQKIIVQIEDLFFTLKDLIYFVNSLSITEDIRYCFGNGRKRLEFALYLGLKLNCNKTSWLSIFDRKKCNEIYNSAADTHTHRLTALDVTNIKASASLFDNYNIDANVDQYCNINIPKMNWYNSFYN